MTTIDYSDSMDRRLQRLERHLTMWRVLAWLLAGVSIIELILIGYYIIPKFVLRGLV